MAVWMGTTIACAQCHDHKYDPLPQKEYFRLFAFFNNTEDADRTDESPILPIFTTDQKRRKAESGNARVGQLEKTLRTPTPQAPRPAKIAGKNRLKPSLPGSRWSQSLSAESGAKLTALEDQLDPGRSRTARPTSTRWITSLAPAA